MAEQQADVKAGLSWILQGKHLPQPPEGKSLAMDLAPTEIVVHAALPNATSYDKEWAPRDPAWWVIANEAIKLGLRSGLDWNKIGLPPVGKTRPEFDPGHGEWIENDTLPS
jgi:hypothetical protein